MNQTVFAENMKKFRQAKKYTQEQVAEKLCDSVAIIKDGKLVRYGSMDEVKGDISLEKVFLDLEAEQ